MNKKQSAKKRSSRKFRPLALIPGLAETGHSAKHWRDARAHLAKKIESLVPGWTHLQKSIFAARWASQNPQDVGFIILFSWQCRTLLRLSSPRSARILDKKIREIVTAVRQDKFDEYYTEWCVLDMLACREKAIGLEPFAGEEADRGTPPLASPDCLVCTGKGDFCIEVTLCRFSRLNRGATHQKEVIAQFMAAAECTSPLQVRATRNCLGTYPLRSPLILKIQGRWKKSWLGLFGRSLPKGAEGPLL